MSTQETGTLTVDPFQENQANLARNRFDECMASATFTESEIKASASQESAMFQMDSDFAYTQAIRKQMVNHLMPSVITADMTINGNTDPELIQAKNRQFSELRSLLSDIESSNKNRVGMKLKQKDLEVQEQQTINAADFLRSIKATDRVITVTNVHEPNLDSQLEEQFKSRGCNILETELEAASNMLPEEKSENEF